MAYVDPLDPATPGDTALVGEGDDRIRELKRALRERIATIVEDIEADPWVIKAGALAEGALDVGVGLDADRPNPATYELWYSSDTKRLWVNHLGGYVPVEGASIAVPSLPNTAIIKRAGYNADAASGSRVSAFTNTSKILTLLVSGTTDAVTGRLTIDLDEIEISGFAAAGDYSVGNLFGIHVNLVSGGISGVNWDVVVFTEILDSGTNTIQLVAEEIGVGLVTGAVLTIYVTMIFGS